MTTKFESYCLLLFILEDLFNFVGLLKYSKINRLPKLIT